MKNVVNKGFIAFVILIAPALLYAQSNEQRLIGAWVDQQDNTWIFYANGIFSMQLKDGPVSSGKYGAAGSKLFLIVDGDELIMDFFISTDGRTLIMTMNGLDAQGGFLLFRKT
jgi:hypothetical protein